MKANEARELVKEFLSTKEYKNLVNKKLKDIYKSIKEQSKRGLSFTYYDADSTCSFLDINNELKIQGYDVEYSMGSSYKIKW